MNTKPHTCFDIERQIALVRYEEGFNSTFGLVVSFLIITNSCNLWCYVSKQVCGFVYLSGNLPLY